jgi:hypothetical protein
VSLSSIFSIVPGSNTRLPVGESPKPRYRSVLYERGNGDCQGGVEGRHRDIDFEELSAAPEHRS